MPYFGTMSLLEYDKNIDYENPAGRKVVKDEDGDLAEIQAGDAIDVELKNTLETFNEKKQKLLLESENIVEDYNNFVKLNFDKNIENRTYDGGDDHTASYSKYFQYFNYQNERMKSSEKNDLIRSINTDYHQLDDPDMIKKVVQARIKYIEGMNAILREIVNKNGKLLGLNSQAIEEIINDLGSDKTTYAMAKIKTKIFENKDKFVKDNDTVLDLRPLGGGVFICADDDPDHNFRSTDNIILAIQPTLTYDLILNGHGSSRSKYEDKKYSDDEIYNDKKRIIKYLSKKISDFMENRTDFISLGDYEEEDDGDKDKYIERRLRAFRNSVSSRIAEDIYNYFTNTVRIEQEGLFERLNKNYDIKNYIKDEYKENLYKSIYGFIKPVIPKINQYRHKNVENILGRSNGKAPTGNEFDHQKWTMSPIKYLDGKKYTDIKQLLTMAKRDGFDKIKIFSCNPAGIDLPSKLKKNVTFSKYSIFKESEDMSLDNDIIIAENYSDIYNDLEDLENQYRTLSEEYGIDYDNDQVLNESYNYFINEEYTTSIDEILLLVEGAPITEKIIELIKKAIEFIVSLVKKFIEAIKNLLVKIYNFITGKKKNTVKKSNVHAAFITVSNDKADITDKVEVENQEQLKNMYTKEIKSIVAVMKHNSDEQVKLEKSLQEQLEKTQNTKNEKTEEDK